MTSQDLIALLTLPIDAAPVAVRREEIGVLNVDFRTSEAVARNRKLLIELSKRKEFCSFGSHAEEAAVVQRLRLDLPDVEGFRALLRQLGGKRLVGWGS